MKRLQQACGFSLVEIALALGIAAFALVAITGLVSICLNTEAKSQDDTVIAAMITQVMADLRRQRFYGDVFMSGTAAMQVGASGKLQIFPDSEGPAPIPPNTPLNPYYFDHSGILLTGSAGAALTQGQAVAAKAVYECIPTITSGTVDALTTGTAVDLLNVCLSFYWPASAISATSGSTVNAPNTRTIYTSIARY
ncbi:MAG TPA: hypothetical protein VHY22_18855 [Chthoniobacteraceae bacterium]|jgi:hypothetical protein|nr:hypothetical protein [Chthoniobacteraceae bacterium]